MVNLNCKNPELEILGLIAHNSDGGVIAWLQSRLSYLGQLSLCGNTRTAIRKIFDLWEFGVGDEVLVPAYNCGSEIDPILKCGADLKMYPLGDDLSIDLDALKKLVSKNTRVIYITHFFGLIHDNIEEIVEFAHARNIKVVEDCALALFSERNGRCAGSFGDAAVFCFYKYFPVIAGGALFVRGVNADISFNSNLPRLFVEKAVVKSLVRRTFGAYLIDKVNKIRKTGSKASIDAQEFGECRSDIPAHYYYDNSFTDSGISKISKRILCSFSVRDVVAMRNRNFKLLREKLEPIPQIRFLLPDIHEGACPLIFPIIVANPQVLCDWLYGKHIDASCWWYGFHRSMNWEGSDNTNYYKNHVVALPIHQYLSPQQIEYMAQQTIRFYENAPEL